jgi:amino acid adenylation domain-containing protein
MHTLITYLENIHKTHSNHTAVEDSSDSGGSLTFAELRKNAVQIAETIIQKRTKHGEKKMIAVYIPKNTKALCAMLGVLYSGNIYSPLDCRAPANRTKLILEIAEPTLIITDEQGKKKLIESGFADDMIIEYDKAVSTITANADEIARLAEQSTQDTDGAYMLFTSGSTGVPKGVLIPHRRVINYINWAKDFFAITDKEIIGNQAPFYFTVSAMDIYLSLATGAKLCLIPENLFARPKNLMQYLNDNKITLIFWVSSVYHHIAKSDTFADIENTPQLKHAWFVGEPMASASLAYWTAKLPDTDFHNLYGSTETDMSLWYKVPKDFKAEDSVPLGQPCTNTQVFVLNDEGKETKAGEIGEIHVRGSCLALGYYKNPDKTEVAFVQNPLHNDYPELVYKTGDLGEIKDGLIYFHGRRDHQFKHLGYRIEAGEIEAVASRFAGVKNNCIIYDDSKRQIVLFYETQSKQKVDELLYRKMFAEELPVYMVPTRVIHLEEMPFNANKKKDRMLLKKQYLEGK